MYEKYNVALRKESGVQFLIKKFKDLCQDNSYVTTIHAINSCVIKLSKLTQAVKVWRGFKGATLPKQFFEPNDAGVRGGIEYGFSSTTTDRDQAVSYASGNQSTIFEMQMGMVDRGADLSWLSQYPHEKEVLFPPLTGLEALSTEVDGSSLLVITRLSLNMTSLTLEQVLSRRRKTLMDMAEGMKGELKQSFVKNAKLAESGSTILKRALEYGYFNKEPSWFNDDDHFNSAVTQALGTKSAVVQSVLRLPLDQKEVCLTALPKAMADHPCRVLVLAGWLRSEPAATSIDFRDVALSEREAIMVAEEIKRLPKLVTLNVLRNDTMGDKGAEALGGALAVGGGGALKSLCGVTPTMTSLEVPRKDLGKIDATLSYLTLPYLTLPYRTLPYLTLPYLMFI